MTLIIENADKNLTKAIKSIVNLTNAKLREETKKSAKTAKKVVESKADRKAWLKAREDLARGDVISHEELKKRYCL